jgi:hypothetical protein
LSAVDNWPLDDKDVCSEHSRISRILSVAGWSPLDDKHFRDGQKPITNWSRRNVLLLVLLLTFSSFINKEEEEEASPPSTTNCKFSQLNISSLFKVEGSWPLEMNVKELHSTIVAYSRHVQLDIGKDCRALQPLIFSVLIVDMTLIKLEYDQISSVRRNMSLLLIVLTRILICVVLIKEESLCGMGCNRLFQ